MKPTFFPTPADFRTWLEKNHDKVPELLVGFYKKGSGNPSITWPESVDEALCFGWIDGVRRGIDAQTYSIRFTPRRARSIWSNVNTKRFAELTKEGRIHPAGLAAFKARDPKRSGIYSYEQRKAAQKLGAAYEAKLEANTKAWKFFRKQPPGYQRLASLWVMSARKEDTRLRRLAVVITDSAAGRRIGPLAKPERR